MFPEGIELDLPNMKTIDRASLRLQIDGINTGEKYYEGAFWLVHSYFSERLYRDSKKGEIDDWDGGKILYLNLDWVRQ